MKKTIISLLLLMPILGCMAQDFSVDGITYGKLDENNVEVMQPSTGQGKYSGDIVIPSKVTYYGKTYSVTEIGGGAFEYCYRLTSITIPNSVTYIASSAFAYCYRLTSITLPNSVTRIRYDTFHECTGLTSVTIPNSVTSIEFNAFEGCTGLTEITIPNSVTSIGSSAFEGCTQLTSVVIPESVTSIGEAAFKNCPLTSVTVSSKATIGQEAFDSSVKLYRIYASNIILDCNSVLLSIDQTKKITATVEPAGAQPGVVWSSSDETVAIVNEDGEITCKGNGTAIITATSVDGTVIATCTIACPNQDYIYVGGIYYLPYTDGHAEVTNMMLGLDTGENERTEYSGTINIPATVTWKGKTYNVTAIHEYAFKRMKDLQGVVIPASVSVIKHQSFCNSSKLARVIFMNADKSELTDIQDSAFYGCSVLNNVTLPNSTLLLGKYSFADCVALSKITLSNKLSFIDEYAFSGCTELSSITLPESLNSIQNYAFSNDTKLAEITFPSELEGIGAGCFLNCSAMQMVTFNTTIATMTVGADAFSGCTKLSKVNVKDLGSLAHTNFNTEKSNPLSLAHHLFQNDKELTTANVPEGTMYVNNYAFSGCTSLKEIKLPSTILYVNDNIFYNCTALTAVRCKAEMVPPFLGTDDPAKMNNVFSKATLYVPEDVVDDYKADDWWKRFSKITEMGDTGIPGDVNGDESVNTSDVVSVYNFIISGDASGISKKVADVNANGEVNSADVVAIYNIIITGNISGQTDKVTSVSLNKTTLTLTSAGQTSQLTATVSPTNATNKSVTWTSSNTSVASVDANGLVTAKATGTATITATAVDGSDKKATCTVTVSINTTVEVKYVSLNKTTLTLTSTGQTSQLTPRILPTNATNKSVTWTSSNTSVATVDANGLVTAKATGTATITATAADGSGKKATCTVTVNINTTVKVTSVSLNKTTLTLTSAGQTSQLTATISPTNATNKSVTWTSSNTSVATVDANGLVTAKATGTATITATAADGSGKKATCTVTVNIEVSEFVVNGIKYSLTGNKTVKVAKDSYSGDIVIPSSVTYGGTTYSVTAIGDYVFNGCSGLTSVTIPNSVTTIGTSAFQGCTSLEGLYISDLAAYCNIDIPASSTTASPIYYAKNLYLNGQLVVNLIVPEGVTKLGNHIFDGCTSIKDVTLPEGLTTIGQGALAIPNMEEVTLPSTVIEIGHFALRSNCLSKIVAKMEDPSAITMGSSCFTDEAYSEVTLYVPPTAINAYKSTKPWSNFSNITPISNNAVEYISEGRYVIVSAGKGPGYYTGANPGDQYDDENKFALYNKDGLVKWKTYDETDDSFVYQITSDENGGWYIYNIADSSYIDRQSSEGTPLGQSVYAGKVTTSTTKNTPQLIEATNKSGKWTIRFKGNQYVYSLTPSHNGAVGTSGFISIWGSNTEAQQYGMNVWYLYKVK